jgi:Flp pilus assembly protein TadG
MARHTQNLDGDHQGTAAMKRGTRAERGSEAGAAAVEAAFTISIMLLLIIGSAEFARAFWTYNTMLLAVEEAGRYAMAYRHVAPVNCQPQSMVTHCSAPSYTALANCSAARAQQVLSAYQAPYIGVSVEEDTTSTPATVTICASYSFDFIAPRFLPFGPLDLTSRVTVPLI